MANLPAGFFDDESEQQAVVAEEAGGPAAAASAPRARAPGAAEPEARPHKRARATEADAPAPGATPDAPAPGAADEALRSLLAFADSVPDDILAESSTAAPEAPTAPAEAAAEAEADEDHDDECDALAEAVEDEEEEHANRVIRAAETAIGRRRGAPDTATSRLLHSLLERKEARLRHDAQSLQQENSPWD